MRPALGRRRGAAGGLVSGIRAPDARVGAGGDQTPSGRAAPRAGLHASSGAGARWGPWGSPRSAQAPARPSGRGGRRGTTRVARNWSGVARRTFSRGSGTAMMRSTARRSTRRSRGSPKTSSSARRSPPRTTASSAPARAGSARIATAVSAAAASSALACLVCRRRAKRFALEPPARWRPWTRRLPTFDARRSRPSKMPTPKPPRRTRTTPTVRGRRTCASSGRANGVSRRRAPPRQAAGTAARSARVAPSGE